MNKSRVGTGEMVDLGEGGPPKLLQAPPMPAIKGPKEEEWQKCLWDTLKTGDTIRVTMEGTVIGVYPKTRPEPNVQVRTLGGYPIQFFPTVDKTTYTVKIPKE